MVETEQFIVRSGVASLKVRGVLVNVFFDAKIYKDEMNGYDVNVYDDVIIDREIGYESTKRKSHKASERLTIFLEDNIFTAIRSRYSQRAIINWLDNDESIGWGE